MSETDSLLVERCLAGDEPAMARFVGRFERLLYRVCYRMLGRREDAEDVVQDVFVRSFRSLHCWDPKRPLAPWLIAIAANRSRTALAKRAKRPVVADIGGRAVEIKTASCELAEELDLALTTLRNDYRECFELFYHDDLSVVEIADRLGVPEGTVKTWLYRARKELAAHLEHRGITPGASR